jgi:hypothetical protein
MSRSFFLSGTVAWSLWSFATGMLPLASSSCSCNPERDRPAVADCDADGDGFTTVECGGCDQDDGDSSVTGPLWVTDHDGDGYGSAEDGGAIAACDQPSGTTSEDGDCDDADPSVNPSAVEICNEIDDDCNGEVDDGSLTTWYADTDGDGFGAEGSTLLACEQPKGTVGVSGDCDDTRPEVHPDATEVCDGLDDDCDGEVDEDLGSAWYPDADGDGFGDAGSKPASTCTPKHPWSEDHTDCDDTRSEVHPGAKEVLCDGLDNDCDGAGGGSVAMLDGVEYLDLQTALDSAPDGDTVFVCPGLHDADVSIDDARTLTLASYTGNSEDTILTGGGTHRILGVSGGGSATVQNITFEQGAAGTAPTVSYEGGGAIAAVGSDLHVEGCSFLENVTSRDGSGGGVLFFSYSDDPRTVEVTGCLFEGNSAGDGGGAAALTGVIVVSDSEFRENSGNAGGALSLRAPYGGGPSDEDDPPAEVSGCTFEANEGRYGGAVNSSDLALTASTLTGNTSDRDGGAIYMEDENYAYGVSLVIESSTFEMNGGLGGAGIAMNQEREDEDSLTIQDSTFEEHDAECGAAIYLSGASFAVRIANSVFESNRSEGFGTVWAHETASLTAVIEDTDFLDNHASIGGVAAIEASGSVSLEISGGEISSNSAERDGGFYIWPEGGILDGVPMTYSFDGTLISGNVSTKGYPGFLEAFAELSDTSLSFSSCTLIENTSAGVAGGIYASDVAVTSIETDWGTGKSDNDPCDLVYWISDEVEEISYCDLGTSETFSCTNDGVCE